MESWRLYHWSSSGGKRLLSTIHTQMQSGVHQALHWPFWLSREWGTLNILVEKVKTAFLKAAWVNDKLHKPSTLLDVLKNPCGMTVVSHRKGGGWVKWRHRAWNAPGTPRQPPPRCARGSDVTAHPRGHLGLPSITEALAPHPGDPFTHPEFSPPPPTAGCALLHSP